MTENNEESRTFFLDKEIVNGLCSPIEEARTAAIMELPEALSLREVRDIAIQVDLAPGASAIEKGRKLKRDALFHIGTTALYEKGDIVTAQSSANELLRDFSIMGTVGYLMVKGAIKRVSKDLVQEIIS